MNRKDYVAYAVFSMVAMCCYFAGKEAFGFFGGISGLALGMFAGFAALVVAHDSLRMTRPTTMPFAWRVHTLTTTRMNISAKQGVLDFRREDN